MEITAQSDEHFMKLALQEAEKAFHSDEVPVGVIVVSKGRVIARAHNLTERLNDVTAHAEMQAVTAAANHLGGKYLNKCTLYVTLEPCCMCAGALYWSQLGKLVYGAKDEKRGFERVNPGLLHPKTELVGGVMAKEASQLMRSFFETKRDR